MEFFFLSLLLFLLLIISISLWFLLTDKQKPHFITPLPPGKVGVPVLGESLEFLSTGRKGIPEKFVEDRMKEYSCQIFKTSLLGEPVAVFCGPAGNKFLFSNENKLVHTWWPNSVDQIFPHSTDSSTKEESKKMRKLLPAFLKPETLQRYVGIMDSIAKKHLETEWINKEEVTVLPLVKKYTFALACRLFLSIEDPDHVVKLAKPFGLVAAGIFSMPINLPGTAFNQAISASKMIRKELGEIIKQRKIHLLEKNSKVEPKQDILSQMLIAADENGQFMNEMDIASKILALLISGHDTAGTALTFIVKYLAELPHCYEEVLREQMEIAKSKGATELLNWEDIQKMRYSWNVVNEVLRVAPPLQGSFREALTDFTYAGFSIPKGWKLYWNAYTTHKNPKYFPDPENFDPSRFEGHGPDPYTFVPFGGGPRMCPGIEYARLEILVFMHNLLKLFRWEKLLSNEKITFNPLPLPVKGLPIRLCPHKS